MEFKKIEGVERVHAKYEPPTRPKKQLTQTSIRDVRKATGSIKIRWAADKISRNPYYWGNTGKEFAVSEIRTTAPLGSRPAMPCNQVCYKIWLGRDRC